MMKHFFFLLFSFVLPLLAAAREIIIDPAWGRETELGSAQTHLIPSLPPRFTIRFFKEHFTVRITSPLSPGEKPRSAGSRNDEEFMFTQDAAEFFICTDPGKRIYYHIAVNPAGLRYTAKKRDITWNPAVKTAVLKGKNSWTAVMEIPYKAVDTVFPAPGHVWRVNFAAKVPMGNGARNSANWSGAKDFHNPGDLGIIRFGKGQLPRLLSWQAKDNLLHAVLCVPVKYASAKAICEIDGKKYPGRRAGSHYLWKVPLFGRYVYPKLFAKVKISLTDKEGKEIFSRSAQAEPEIAHQFDLKGFYCPPQMKELAYTHTFPRPARMTLRNDSGKILRRFNAPAEGKFSLAALAPGRYTAELETASHITSRVFFITDITPQQVKESDRFEIRNGLFHLGEKAVFLVGGSATPKAHLQTENVFNLRTGNSGYMKNAVLFQGTVPYRYSRTPFSHYHLQPEPEKHAERAAAVSSPGNRLVHRLAYEAQIQLTTGKKEAPVKIDTPRFYAELYKKLKAKYPAKYFSLEIDRPERIDDFVRSCDIFEFACYSSTYAVNMMPNLPEDMKMVRKKAGHHPVILWLGGSIPNPVCRTAEELRAAVFCAAALDINGVIIHLGHGGLASSRARLWSLISGINREINSFYADFSSGIKTPGFIRELKGDFLVSARKCGPKTLVLVVSLSAGEQTMLLKTQAGEIRKKLTPYEPLLLTFPGK